LKKNALTFLANSRRERTGSKHKGEKKPGKGETHQMAVVFRRGKFRLERKRNGSLCGREWHEISERGFRVSRLLEKNLSEKKTTWLIQKKGNGRAREPEEKNVGGWRWVESRCVILADCNTGGQDGEEGRLREGEAGRRKKPHLIISH